MSHFMNYPEIICHEIQKTAEKNVYFKISKGIFNLIFSWEKSVQVSASQLP